MHIDCDMLSLVGYVVQMNSYVNYYPTLRMDRPHKLFSTHII